MVVGWTILAVLWVVGLLASPFSVWKLWHERTPYPDRTHWTAAAWAQRRAILPLVLSIWSMTGMVLCEIFGSGTTGWRLKALEVCCLLCLVALGISIVLIVTIVRLDWPRCCVPPSMRDESGLPLSGWR